MLIMDIENENGDSLSENSPNSCDKRGFIERLKFLMGAERADRTQLNGKPWRKRERKIQIYNENCLEINVSSTNLGPHFGPARLKEIPG